MSMQQVEFLILRRVEGVPQHMPDFTLKNLLILLIRTFGDPMLARIFIMNITA